MRTIEEIDKDWLELQERIVADFVKRTPIGNMMTAEQDLEFQKLSQEMINTVLSAKE